VDLRTLRSSCRQCPIAELCLPLELDAGEIDALERIVQHNVLLRQNDILYDENERFSALFMVRSGAMKIVSSATGGDSRILGFFLPGEMLGFEGLSSGAHVCQAIALQTTSVCRIPFDELHRLAGTLPGLRYQLLRMMSRKHFAGPRSLDGMTGRPAGQRLAATLLSLADRYGRQGLSRTRFVLPMSRGDLANYLGLSPATLSRVFARFRQWGWIRDARNDILLEDVDNLAAFAGAALDSIDAQDAQLCR